MRNRLAASVAAVSMMALAGCATETSGSPAPAQPSQSAAAAAAHPEVHVVARPLDPTKFEADPCGLVPRETISGLGFPDPGTAESKSDALTGPNCNWISTSSGRRVSVTLQTGNRDSGIGGLNGIYTGHDSGQMPFVENAPDVSGYQAVYADRQDRRSRGACNLHVAIRDDLVFSVGDQGYDGQQDSCDAARQVAAAVVKTLKGA
jgi:hypothetical protein